MANFFGVGQSPLGQRIPRNLPGFAPAPINIGQTGRGGPLSLTEFLQDRSLNPWGGANEANTMAAYQRYVRGFGGGAGGLPAGAGAPIGGPGSGALPGSYNPASGGIPQTPTSAESLDNLLKSIAGNVGNLGSIIGGITAGQQNALLQQYSPQYKNALATVAGNVANRATGNINDLLPQIGQYSGEWGIGQGVAGGPGQASNLAKSVLGSSYNVQEQALRDMGLVKEATPTVAPYDPARLLPTYPEQYNRDLTERIYGAAPVPESAYQRARADALAGIARGLGGFNQGAGFNPQRSPLLPVGFGGQINNVPTPSPVGPAAPANPGWGFGFNNQGGYAGVGNIPQDELVRAAQRGANVPQMILPPGVGPDYFEGVGNIYDPLFGTPQQDIEEEFYDF